MTDKDQFKFSAASLANVLAPGLSISSLLEFTPEEEEEVRDNLVIHVDTQESTAGVRSLHMLGSNAAGCSTESSPLL